VCVCVCVFIVLFVFICDVWFVFCYVFVAARFSSFKLYFHICKYTFSSDM
jgi:hypothetical protein